MIRSLILIIAILVASPTKSETIRVQAGNHPTFVRLVLYLPDVDGWGLGRDGDGYQFRGPREEDDFDLSTAFDVVPRDRVLELLDLGGGRLQIDLACECYAEAFTIPQGVVLDIRDGAAPESAAYEKPLDAPLPAPEAVLVEAPPVPAAPPAPQAPTIQTRLSAYEISDVLRFEQRYVAPRAAVELTPEEPMVEDDAEDAMAESGAEDMPPGMASAEAPVPGASEIQAELIAQIGRAASQGLIEADLRATEDRLAATQQTSDEAMSATPEALPDEEALTELLRNNLDHIRLETAIDRGLQISVGQLATTQNGALCLPDSMFDVPDWGESEHQKVGFFLGRTSVVGEFDAVDLAELEALVKSYLYLTFGLEAAELIKAFDAQLNNRLVYFAMAEIMDEGAAITPAITADQTSCEGRVAMWAMLAHEDASQFTTVSTKSVLGTFNEMPLHLRRHLGPTLAKRFLDFGDLDTARGISSSISRAPGDAGPGLDMLNAEIALAAGDPGAAVDGFEAVFRENGPLAIEAAIRMIDEGVDNQVDLPRGMPVATAAMAHETRGTETASELLRVQIRSEANAGNLTKALDMTHDLGAMGKLSAQQVVELNQELYRLAVDSLPDASFVLATMRGEIDLAAGDEAMRLRRDIAARLISVGVPQRAREVLAQNDGALEAEDRQIMAQSFIAEGRPDRALAELEGLASDDAMRLKATAHVRAGNLAVAALLYRDLGDDAAAEALLWRNQDWSSIAKGPEGERQRVAQMAVSPEPEPLEGPIAQNRSLISRSQTARDAISEMLKSVERP